MEAKKVVIIFNPKSGRGRFLKYKDEIKKMFIQANYNVTLYETVAPKDATDAAIEFAKKQYDLIVASGGDGTLHEVINGVMTCSFKPEIGYIPSGTTNDFARSLGIPLNPLSATSAILKEKTLKIDIGQLNDVYFIYVTAFGAFTPISYQTPSKTKSAIGYFAYLLEAGNEWKKLNHYKVRVIVDDEEKYKLNTLITMVVNSRTVAGIAKLLPDAKMNDGLFDLLLFEVTSKKKIVNLFAFIKRFLTGFRRQNIEKAKVNQGIKHLIGAKFDIRTSQDVTWNVDGEQGPTTNQVIIQIHQQAIKMRINNN